MMKSFLIITQRNKRNDIMKNLVNIDFKLDIYNNTYIAACEHGI